MPLIPLFARPCGQGIGFQTLWYFTEQMYSNMKWMLNEWLSFINAFLTVFLFSLFSVELEVFVLRE